MKLDSAFITGLLQQIASIDVDVVLLFVLIIAGLIVLRNIHISVTNKQKETGMVENSIVVSVDGSKSMPVRQYVSELQGLAGKPDALISEEGNLIPIERKPLARKIRDRYVAQLLVYMRLVEEFEGKKPPYGYLILGPTCRRFKIENSPERQGWLQEKLDEMNAVMKSGKANPAPHPRKCAKCDVNEACKFCVL